MFFRLKRLAALGAALGLALGVTASPVAPRQAASTGTTAPGARPPHFVAPGAIDLASLLPAPPAADSLVQRAELEVLLRLQAERTATQVDRAQRVNAEDVFTFGSDVLGEWFNAKNLPETAALFAKVRDDFAAINRSSKALYNRRRPPFVEARLKPCVEFADTGSYPSGHAMQAAIWVELLSVMFPEKASAFALRADETRWCRLLAGVHYASDVEAGRIVGEAIAREMLLKTGMREMLVELRTEALPHRQR